jgi:pyridoxamine 5'-phosphate oxidase
MSNQIDPIAIFSKWFKEAKNHANIIDHTAMALATATKSGKPSSRMVLLKDYDAEQFTFYTNLTSRKSLELKENPFAALCFYWAPLNKQVRIEGKIIKVSKEEANAYFATRSRNSQISAWASKQSVILDKYEDFEERVAKISKNFKDMEIPRPPFWSGFALKVRNIELWEDELHRRHKRYYYEKIANGGWQMNMLYP